MGADEHPLLACSMEQLPEAVVVRPRGEVDLFTAPVLRRYLTDAAQRHGTVVIDLRGVGYLDASGVHVVEDFAHGNTRILIVCMPPVQRIIEITKLFEAIPVFPTLDRAMEYVRIRL